jgi:diguanylate cyclase (GGDEF)-like protein
LTVVPSFSSMQERIDARINEASKLYGNCPAVAYTLVEEAIQESYAARYERGRANALRVRAMTRGVTGAIDDALEDFSAALDLARVLGDRSLEASCLHGIGMARQHRNEYALALEALHHAVQIRRDRLQNPDKPPASASAPETTNDLPDASGLAMSLNSLGGLYGTLGNFKEAAACFTEALAVSEATDNRRNQQNALCNIALIQVECGEPEAALPFFERSIALAQEADDWISVSNNLSNYANTLRKLNRLDDARAAAEKAVEAARSVGNAPAIMIALMNLGRVQRDQGELAEATITLDAALTAAPSRHYLLSALYQEIATVHQRLGRREAARHQLQEALHQAEEAGQKHDISLIHQKLSALLAEMGDHAAALQHHITYHTIDLELQRQSARNLMVAQLARIEVEQARKEAEHHRQRTAELAAMDTQKSALLVRLQAQADQLAKQATEDPLTGLYNRRYLSDFLEREVERVRRAGLPLTIAIADLDDFKRINDRFSHKIGDEVLKITARLFIENVRGTDVVARYGGEEFIVVLPEQCAANARAALERIRAAIAAFPWEEVHPGLSVTVSIGMSDAPEAPAQLLEAADSNLYSAKLYGKNRIR